MFLIRLKEQILLILSNNYIHHASYIKHLENQTIIKDKILLKRISDIMNKVYSVCIPYSIKIDCHSDRLDFTDPVCSADLISCHSNGSDFIDPRCLVDLVPCHSEPGTIISPNNSNILSFSDINNVITEDSNLDIEILTRLDNLLNYSLKNEIYLGRLHEISMNSEIGQQIVEKLDQLVDCVTIWKHNTL